MITRGQAKRKREKEEVDGEGEPDVLKDSDQVKSNPPIFPNEVILSIGKALNHLGLYGTPLNLLLTSRIYSEFLLRDLYRHVELHSPKAWTLLKEAPFAVLESMTPRYPYVEQKLLHIILRDHDNLQAQTKQSKTYVSRLVQRLGYITTIDIPLQPALAVDRGLGVWINDIENPQSMCQAFPNLRTVRFTAPTGGDWGRTCGDFWTIFRSLSPPLFCVTLPHAGSHTPASDCHEAIRALGRHYESSHCPRKDVTPRVVFHGVCEATDFPYSLWAELEYHFVDGPPLHRSLDADSASAQADQFPTRCIISVVEAMLRSHQHNLAECEQEIWETMIPAVSFYGALKHYNPMASSEADGQSDLDLQSILLGQIRAYWIDHFSRVYADDDIVPQILWETGMDEEDWEGELTILLDVILGKLVFRDSATCAECTQCGCGF